MRVGVLVVCCMTFVAAVAGAAATHPGPRAPCAGAPYPAFPMRDAPPNVATWTSDALGPEWSPPRCTDWAAGPTDLVVALAGHFGSKDGVDLILSRIGAISRLTEVRYWSVTDKRWNKLFERATGLAGPDPSSVRADFSPAELRTGMPLYFLSSDNRSREEVVSALRVREVDARQIVLETENISPLRWLIFTLIPSGGIHNLYMLDRQPDGSWRFYGLMRVLEGSFLASLFIPEASYINRAVAIYRHVAGIPTDHAPPAAP